MLVAGFCSFKRDSKTRSCFVRLDQELNERHTKSKAKLASKDKEISDLGVEVRRVAPFLCKTTVAMYSKRTASVIFVGGAPFTGGALLCWKTR